MSESSPPTSKPNYTVDPYENPLPDLQPAPASKQVVRCAHVDRTCEGAHRCVLPATSERHLHVWGAVPEVEETDPWQPPPPNQRFPETYQEKFRAWAKGRPLIQTNHAITLEQAADHLDEITTSLLAKSAEIERLTRELADAVIIMDTQKVQIAGENAERDRERQNWKKEDGFMRLEEAIEALATGYSAYYEDDESHTLRVVKSAGRVRSDTLGRLMREGWVEGHANGGGFKLSDAGFRSYLRSQDELGDGKLVAPIIGGGQLPNCPRCHGPVRVQLMGTLVCDTCKTGVSG